MIHLLQKPKGPQRRHPNMRSLVSKVKRSGRGCKASLFKHQMEGTSSTTLRNTTLRETESNVTPTMQDVHSNIVKGTSVVQETAPLEKLLPEVRRSLLSVLDFQELQALVHASPTYYQQYLLDRSFFLHTCLGTTV